MHRTVIIVYQQAVEHGKANESIIENYIIKINSY